MFRHYLLVAFRSIRRDRVYNILTLLCLAIGVSLFAILSLVRENDLFYENRLPGYSRTLRGEMVDSSGFNSTYSFPNIKDVERFYVPGVEAVVQRVNSTKESHFLFYDKNDTEYPINVSYNYVSNNYFKYHNLKLKDGDRMPKNQYEVIVSESLLKLLTLNDDDINTLNIRILSENGELSDETYRIVNVVRDDRWSRNHNGQIFFFLNEDYNKENSIFSSEMIYFDVMLDKGADIDDVKEKLKINGYIDMTPPRRKVNDNGPSKKPYTVNIPSLARTEQYQQGSLFGSLLLYILVLIVGLISYLKRLVITLKRKKRNTIIRYCTGADRRSLFKMPICEILIMLTFTLLLALFMSYMATLMLNNSETIVLEHSLYYSDVAIIESFAILGVLAISAIVIFISVNRYHKTLFASNFLTHKEKHLLRNIMIGIELAVATYGLCFAISFIWYGIRPYNPLPRSEFNRTVCINFRSDKTMIERSVPIYQIIDEIKELSQVEEVVCLSAGAGSHMAESMKFGDNLYASFNGGNHNYFDFFNIPIQRFYSQDAENDVYLKRSMYDKMVKDSIYLDYLELTPTPIPLPNMPKVQRKTTVYRIAGIYEEDFGAVKSVQELEYGSLFMTNINAWQNCYIRFVPGIGTEKGKQLVLDVIRSYVPETVDIPISKLKKWESYDYSLNIKLWTGGSIVCILLVILSVTTAITADTERRRKEVSLRKINGAKSHDIAVLFVRPYTIILTVAFIVGYSIFAMKNGFTDHFISWIAPIVLAAMILIIALSVFLKVRQIMHTNPAEVIKSE